MIDNRGLQERLSELYSLILSDMARLVSVIQEVAESVANSPREYLVYRDVIDEKVEAMSKLHQSVSQQLDCAVQEQITCVENDTFQTNVLASLLHTNGKIGLFIDSVKKLCSSIN